MFNKDKNSKEENFAVSSAEVRESKTSCLPEALLIGGLVILGIILIRRARVPDKTVVHLVYYGGCWNPYPKVIGDMAHIVEEAIK